MPHDPAKSMLDVQMACEAIRRFCAGRTLDQYRADLQLRSAVERQFIIIGEALNRVRHAKPDLLDGIEPVARIIGFRNVLVHGYEVIDDAVVWGIITEHLAALEADARSIVDRLEADCA